MRQKRKIILKSNQRNQPFKLHLKLFKFLLKLDAKVAPSKHNHMNHNLVLSPANTELKAIYWQYIPLTPQPGCGQRQVGSRPKPKVVSVGTVIALCDRFHAQRGTLSPEIKVLQRAVTYKTVRFYFYSLDLKSNRSQPSESFTGCDSVNSNFNS